MVELDNGNVHQVLADADKKKIAIALLRDESGSVLLSERVEPITLQPFEQTHVRNEHKPRTAKRARKANTEKAKINPTSASGGGTLPA